MKKLIPTLVFLICTNLVCGQVDRDKALHYLGGNLYGLAGAGIAKQISNGNRWWTFAGAIGGSTLIGLGKEAVDASQRENGWDNQDLLATILGGATVGITIDIFTDHKKKQRPRRLASNHSSFLNKNWSDQSLGYFQELDRMPTLTELAMPTTFLSHHTD